MTTEGMPIEGAEPRRGPGRPPLRRDEGLRPAEALRPDLRPDSEREAEEYARKIMEGGVDLEYNGDVFHFDPSEIPPGWNYEWKAEEIIGKDNRHHMSELRRKGWREVQSSRHRERMPDGYEGPIRIDGQILMEWPKILVEEMKLIEKREAKGKLRDAEAKLHEAPPKTGPRNDPGLTSRGLNRGATKEIVNPRARREDD